MTKVYHGTTVENYRGIQVAKALKPAGGSGADAFARLKGWELADLKRKPSVYVATRKNWARQFAHYAMEANKSDQPIILTLEIPDDKFKSLFKPDEADDPNKPGDTWRTEKSIPAAWITKAEPISTELSLGELLARI